MEARCVFYVKFGMFAYLEQCKISLMMVNISGIVRVSVRHDLMVSVSLM